MTPIIVVDRHHDLIYQIDEMIAIRKKTSSVGIRDLRKIRRRLVELTRETSKVLRVPTNLSPRVRPAPNFGRTVVCDRELTKFLGLSPGEEVSAREVMVAISTYIHRDPRLDETRQRWLHLNLGSRDLRDPNHRDVTIPDAKLSRLLRYEEYRARVARGEVVVVRDHPIYDRKESVVVTDDRLKWWVVTKLAWGRMAVPKGTSEGAVPKPAEGAASKAAEAT